MLGLRGLKKKKIKRAEGGLGEILLTCVFIQLCVHVFKWGGSLRHRVVTTIRVIL